MDFDEYRSFDAIGLAGLVATGEVSATELAKATIDRVSAVNETINAVVGARFESAFQEASAGLPEGPLRGVPYLIKDLGLLPARGTGDPRQSTVCRSGGRSRQRLHRPLQGVWTEHHWPQQFSGTGFVRQH